MNSPVSAFSVYNANKIKNFRKKNKLKQKKRISRLETQLLPREEPNEDVLIGIAQKFKQNMNKKQPKKVFKKNNRKKDHSMAFKKKGKKNETFKNCTLYDDKEDITDLVPSCTKLNDSHFETPSDDSSPNLDSILSIDEQNKTVNTENPSSDFDEEYPPGHMDSEKEGLRAFKWMIAPYKYKNFFRVVWENQPLHIVRNKPAYYKDLISTPIIDNMLRNESIQYTKNLDVTSYVNGKRMTHNLDGRAYPRSVWNEYLNGRSIRLLNPQTYIPSLYKLNATLQEYFKSFVGANAYLTPPDTQGFAPHYDDIEAFILQVEGKKHWKIYKPRINEELPRFSSKNFKQHEIGNPIFEFTVNAGDLLYFPRGYIHQGVTIDGEHSLHLTISMYQKHSWADLFERMVPNALESAINENREFRQGLPLNIYDNFGFVHSHLKTSDRKTMRNYVKILFDKIRKYLDLDEAVDLMSINYQNDALPPVLTDLEKSVTVFGDTDKMIENGQVIKRTALNANTRVRLLRKNILRLVSEEGSYKIYYNVENSLEYHGNELSYLDIDEDVVPIIAILINVYPMYKTIKDLNIDDSINLLEVIQTLWDKGLLMTEKPLNIKHH